MLQLAYLKLQLCKTTLQINCILLLQYAPYFELNIVPGARLLHSHSNIYFMHALSLLA